MTFCLPYFIYLCIVSALISKASEKNYSLCQTSYFRYHKIFFVHHIWLHIQGVGKKNLFFVLVVWVLGGPGQKSSNKQPKFLNLLILVHLRNYFIEVLNKFLMCFKINGLKNFKLTTLMVFCLVPPITLTTLQ